MTKQNDTWDPETRVSLPRTAVALPTHEHGDVRFAAAMDERHAQACFVRENVEGSFWCRISEADYLMVTARSAADPNSKLIVGHVDEHHLNVVFRPAAFDIDKLPGRTALLEAAADETDVTVIRVRILAHKEAA